MQFSLLFDGQRGGVGKEEFEGFVRFGLGGGIG